MLAQAYALEALVAFVGVAAVIGCHVLRDQGVTSLDALAAVFAATNLVLYFGLDSSVLLEHLDAAFYTLLAARSLLSLRGSSPWTMQFTRRTVVPELWTSEALIAMNVRTTQLWAACFVLCDTTALTLPDPSRVWGAGAADRDGGCLAPGGQADLHRPARCDRELTLLRSALSWPIAERSRRFAERCSWSKSISRSPRCGRERR